MTKDAMTDKGIHAPRLRIDESLRRIREGDRAEAASFFQRYESRIRRRIRGKLRESPAMRRVYDSLDLMSSIGRRLDLFVLRGHLRARSENEFISLIQVIADRAFIDKSRLFRRLREADRADGALARHLLDRLEDTHGPSTHSFGEEVALVFELIDDPSDRTLLLSWMNDEPWQEAAHLLDLPVATVRKRWQRLRDHLGTRLAPLHAG
jgi:DNA-directed RNA polymerase specialized sigma24 family protein